MRLYDVCVSLPSHLLTENTVQSASCVTDPLSHSAPLHSDNLAYSDDGLKEKKNIHLYSLTLRSLNFHPNEQILTACHKQVLLHCLTTLCLVGKLKQDIAPRSGPSMSFMYKQNKKKTVQHVFCSALNGSS